MALANLLIQLITYYSFKLIWRTSTYLLRFQRYIGAQLKQ